MAGQVEKIDFESGFSDLLKETNAIPHGAKEIFLRELVFNALRALVRLRLETLYEEDIDYGIRGLHIEIIPDKSNNTLSIVDNGTGMKKEALKALLSVKRKGYHKDSPKDLTWIHIFMVADCFEVTTHHYETDNNKPCKLFSSPTDNYFVVQDVVSKRITPWDTNPWGTKVTLTLNKDHSEYLDLDTLNELIDKYPISFCQYPIYICSPVGRILRERLADFEERQINVNALMIGSKGLVQVIKSNLVPRKMYLKDVVLSLRYPDVPAVLSLDREILYISPRGVMMADLRFEAEQNPDDEDLCARIRLLYMAAVHNLEFYDSKHGTNYARHHIWGSGLVNKESGARV